MATVSPGMISRLTPRTASTVPSGVLKRTWRSSTESSGSGGTSVIPRIERVAETIPKEIEGEQKRHEKDGGKNQQPGSRLNGVGAFGDQGAKAGQRLLDAQ